MTSRQLHRWKLVLTLIFMVERRASISEVVGSKPSGLKGGKFVVAESKPHCIYIIIIIKNTCSHSGFSESIYKIIKCRFKFKNINTFTTTIFKLEVTIARKVLPHPQGIKGSMRNLLNKGLFI
jgi:hypothetical protein